MGCWLRHNYNSFRFPAPKVRGGAGSKSNASWKFQFSCERERRFRRGGTRKSHKKSDRAIAPHGRWTLVRPPQGFGAFDCAPRSLPRSEERRVGKESARPPVAREDETRRP